MASMILSPSEGPPPPSPSSFPTYAPIAVGLSRAGRRVGSPKIRLSVIISTPLMVAEMARPRKAPRLQAASAKSQASKSPNDCKDQMQLKRKYQTVPNSHDTYR